MKSRWKCACTGNARSSPAIPRAARSPCGISSRTADPIQQSEAAVVYRLSPWTETGQVETPSARADPVRRSPPTGIALRQALPQTPPATMLSSTTFRTPGLAVLIACLAAAAPFTASALPKAGKADGEATGAPAQPHPVLDRIKASGHIVLAHRESSVPFSYYDANRKPIGYTLELCKDLAETLRKHLNMPALQID